MMPTTKFTVAIKPVEGNEPEYYDVSSVEAQKIQIAWDAHRNCYVGDQYVPWTRILGITAPPKEQIAIERPPCDHCKGSGWVSRDDPDPLYEGRPIFGPCRHCNGKGMEDVAQYAKELQRQEWYRRIGY
jgi:hypothetical protein